MSREPGGVVDGALKHGVLGGKDGGDVKEIKVMVPAEYHKKLHVYKVLTSKTISEMVNEALDRYFRGLEEEAERDG